MATTSAPTSIELDTEQAQAINEILSALDQPATRKALGLFGAHGSGKTVVLNEFARDGIRARRTPQHRKVVCAVINAANLPTDLAPWQRLIFGVLDKLAQQPGASSTINDLRAELHEVVQHEAHNDDSATLAAAAFAHHLRAAFAGLVHSAITLSNATFVVAIDHIDKTTPENAAQLLEASRYFLNAQNCATLICADESALVALLGDDGQSTLSAWLTGRIDLLMGDPAIKRHSPATPLTPAAPASLMGETPQRPAPKPIASDIPQPCVQLFTDALGSDRYAIERAGDHWRSAMRALARRNADGYHTHITGPMIAKLCALRVLSPSLFDAVRFDAPALVTLERRARTHNLAYEGHDEWTEALARDARLVALFKFAPSFIGVETRDLATALRLVHTGDAELNEVRTLLAKPATNRATILGAPSGTAATATAAPSAPAATRLAAPASASASAPTPITTPAPTHVPQRRRASQSTLPPAIWTLVSVAAGTFIVDRLVKMAVQSGAMIGNLVQPQPPITGSLVNSGLATGAELVGIALCALIAIFSGLRLSNARSTAFGLIVGGLTANLFDRLTQGAVMNYLHIGNLPVFNLAHATLLAGAILLAYAILTGDRGDDRRRDTSDLAHE